MLVQKYYGTLLIVSVFCVISKSYEVLFFVYTIVNWNRFSLFTIGNTQNFFKGDYFFRSIFSLICNMTKEISWNSYKLCKNTLGIWAWELTTKQTVWVQYLAGTKFCKANCLNFWVACKLISIMVLSVTSIFPLLGFLFLNDVHIFR